MFMEPQSVVSAERSPSIQDFFPGDTVRVGVRVREGDRERVQIFQGVVIRKRGKRPGTTFTVRRVSYGIGVERTFPLYSPLVETVEVVRRGDVRQANLYYLRGLHGRAARIKERAWTGSTEAPEVIATEQEASPEEVEEPEKAEEPQVEKPRAQQGETTEEPQAEHGELTEELQAEETEQDEKLQAEQA
jgi:large subunit ribosomal protein L19